MQIKRKPREGRLWPEPGGGLLAGLGWCSLSFPGPRDDLPLCFPDPAHPVALMKCTIKQNSFFRRLSVFLCRGHIHSVKTGHGDYKWNLNVNL